MGRAPRCLRTGSTTPPWTWSSCSTSRRPSRRSSTGRESSPGWSRTAPPCWPPPPQSAAGPPSRGSAACASRANGPRRAAREALAARLDAAPGTLLPDRVLLALAADPPATPGRLWQVPGYSRRHDAHRHTWMTALAGGRALGPADYPPDPAPSPVPPHGRWPQVAPAAAETLAAAKEAYRLRGRELGTPPENLLRPKTLRAVTWAAVEEGRLRDAADLRRALREEGARPWQADLACAVLGPLWWA
ncbi:HRDC domain-containing protein [Corynebacterium mastitidis]|uniref:HRDC domain-containing protein n=1 Tax=Corynebacterium mastitidis TaxID=161890 RepID=UPI0032B6FDD9